MKLLLTSEEQAAFVEFRDAFAGEMNAVTANRVEFGPEQLSTISIRSTKYQVKNQQLLESNAGGWIDESK